MRSIPPAHAPNPPGQAFARAVAAPATRDAPPRETRTGLDIRIVIADDHDMLRSGLRTKLESAAEDELGRRLVVVAEARDGLEAIEAVEQHRPDVLVLDIRMPLMDGLACMSALAERKLAGVDAPTKVIALTV